jgi:hypothetical protein
MSGCIANEQVYFKYNTATNFVRLGLPILKILVVLPLPYATHFQAAMWNKTGFNGCVIGIRCLPFRAALGEPEG